MAKNGSNFFVLYDIQKRKTVFAQSFIEFHRNVKWIQASGQIIEGFAGSGRFNLELSL